MNRNQRRYGKVPKKNVSETKFKGMKAKEEVEEETIPQRPSRKETRGKPMRNRSCYYSPEQRDNAQLTDEYTSVLKDQFAFNPMFPESTTQLEALRRILCGSTPDVRSSQPTEYVETADGTQWQNVDNADDIDRFILQGKDEGTMTRYRNLSNTIYIHEVPRVKIIAEKFSRYKLNNVELRKLDEKVVCVEYDVFDKAASDSKPAQIMRAFFSIRPVYDANDEKPLQQTPHTVKNKFNIAFEDLQKLSEREVEMIDSEIAENRPYLDDLRKILRRKEVITTKHKNSLDLQTLYDLATMEHLDFEGKSANLISKEELHEVKDLILKTCKSSVHGINRRTVRREGETDGTRKISAVSQSIVAELHREEGKVNV